MAFLAMRPAVFTELFVIEGVIGFAHAADIRILHRHQARDPRRQPGRDRHRRLYDHARGEPPMRPRSEEHTSELQSLMRISYAVFCLKKKNKKHTTTE